ncbi:IS110 family transposase [Pseudoduganella sp. SL102]|uniref:IS110 family transposase n=1 Tax=Pseudoduganella sp. SL102 TaxID=2995154 RepID=UPI00248ABA18|nr:IS110 family transposase [Pseudoduganella sp. SL102]WBS04247.1 IS110 family transposase [Pseudoduganella sp. SL102]WBS05014.1 IS110 family transposase [Pseudoduganella sp. SL102]
MMEMAVTPVVGVDVSKKKLDIVLLVSGKAKSKTLSNTPEGYQELVQWLVKQKVSPDSAHVCLEATGVYSEPLALWLHDAGIMVSVINPGCIKGFGQSENIRNKNDQIDAGLIARFCAAKRPPVWVPPPKEQRELKGLSDRLLALKDIRQQEKNRMEAHDFAGQGDLVKNVDEHVKWLDQKITELEKEIDDHIDRHPGLKRDADLMRSIPGIGSTTIAKVLGHIGDIRRFGSAKALAAFIGVSPKQKSSGTSVRGRTSMSKIGNNDLRSALYMPGMVAKRYNTLLKTFAERLSANGMAPKAVTGAVMRKLVHLIYGVVCSGKPFDPNFLNSGLAKQDGI